MPSREKKGYLSLLRGKYMIINKIVAVGNPFIDAYTQSDWVGKLIYLSLICLSVITWAVLLFKWREARRSKERALLFKKQFTKFRLSPLQIETQEDESNPFISLYRLLKKKSLEILNKNLNSEKVKATGVSMLSYTDISMMYQELDQERKRKRAGLERHLYILATVVSLGPFLGILGTVWGILISFSHLHMASGLSNQAVLNGLSLALVTTVIGLIDAIPALIGYNYLRQRIRDLDQEMESFSHEILSAVELQYRQVDL